MPKVQNTVLERSIDTEISSDEVLEQARAHARTHATYAVVPGEVLTDPRLSDAAKVLYALLELHQGTSGSAWPSVDRLAAMAGWSVRKVQRATSELTAAGFLTVRHRAYTTNRYEVQNSARARWEKRTRTAPPVTGVTPYPVTGVTVTTTNEETTNNNNGPTITSTPTPPVAAVVGAVDPQIRELLEAMPSGVKPTRALRADLAALAAAEWTAEDVREWTKGANGPGVLNPGGLAARLVREATDTAAAPPTLAARQAKARERADLEARLGNVPGCAHGEPRGASACALCRKAAATVAA